MIYTDMQDFCADVSVSIMRAIWDEVTPGLRAVALRVEYPNIFARFIYEDNPTEEEVEEVSVAETEVYAEFWNCEGMVTFTAIRVPVSVPLILLPNEARWVYMRKGDNPNNSIPPDVIDYSSIQNFWPRTLTSIQYALLGMVTPNLRAVVIKISYPEFSARFIYEEEPTEEEREDVSIMEAKVVADLHKDAIVTFTAEQIPTTTRINSISCDWRAYMRKETHYYNPEFDHVSGWFDRLWCWLKSFGSR